MQRRDFIKLSAAAGAVNCLVGCNSSSDNQSPQIPEIEPAELQVNYTSCLVNCGSNCPVKVYSRDGEIVRIETDSEGDDQYGHHQTRACLRGRSLRQRNYTADRNKYPMKRTGPRGSGQFTRISWEQAFREIAAKTQELRQQYGPRAIYQQEATINYAFAGPQAISRALGVSGGYLNFHYNWSVAQLMAAGRATFGPPGVLGTQFGQIVHSDLVMGFGINPFENRMSGSGEMVDFREAVDARRASGQKLDLVIIDPRYTDTALGKEDQWVPIRPGTDGALAEAIAYEMISSGWVDANSKAFLDQFCLGYDAASLQRYLDENPGSEHAQFVDPAENYHDYIMGLGKYAGRAPRTLAWGADICGVPERKIKELADMIMASEAPYFSIGCGPQRHACGEQTMRALYMLSFLTGKLGNPGVNTGEVPMIPHMHVASKLPSPNPETASIPVHIFAEAMLRGEEMTATADGVEGLGEGETSLGANIKAIFLAGANSLMNQQSDINYTRAIVEDESKCELIVVIDPFMTASARFADYVLPAETWPESNDMTDPGHSTPGQTSYLICMSSSLKPFYESKNLFEIGRGLAKEWGVEAEYTEGLSHQQWLERLYRETREHHPAGLDLPESLDEAQKIGFFRHFNPADHTALKSYVKDGQPLPTPSGKIEIYSLDWAKKRVEWQPRSDADYDQITPLPQYTAAWQGYEDEETRHDYPLQVVGFHTKARVHSSYFNSMEWLHEANDDSAWFNPLDAQKYGVENGGTVTLTSPRGSMQITAKITPRVMPGVVAVSQGRWYTGLNLGATDQGGCLNTLTNYHPTPVCKGNPQHTIRAKVGA